MAVAFRAIYQKQQSGRWTCLLAADGQPQPNVPWTGIYIASDKQQALSTLDQIFKQFENALQLNLLAFIHFAGSASPNADQIGTALDAIKWPVPSKTGVVTWIATPDLFTPASIPAAQASIDAAPRLPIEPYKAGPRSPVIPSLSSPERQPLMPLGPAGQAGSESLFVTGEARVAIGTNPAGDGLLLSCGAGLTISRGTTAADPDKKIIASGTDASGTTTTMSSIQIPVVAANNGCLVFGGALQTPVSGIGLGFQYGLTVQDGSLPSGAITYPMLDASDGLNGWPVSVMLSILAPFDVSHCYVSLSAGGGPMLSAFRTLLDHAILLKPQADGSSLLVFNPGFGGSRYLTPHGAFTLSIEGDGEPTKGLGSQLLCGLSGLEYIHFAADDLLWFYSGANATIDVKVDPNLPPPANVTFAFDPAKTAQTAWAMVLPADPKATDRGQYYSEPDQAPFFAKSDLSADPEQLGFYGLSLSQLPGDAGNSASPYQFPLLPYGAFVPAVTGFGNNPAYVEMFEYQLLNPTRKALIEAMAAKVAPTSQDPDITAITPEGYAAEFTGGKWTKLRIAQMGASNSATDIEIEFAAATDSIPQALQDAFLTNQQFLVITSPKNLGLFTNTVQMDSWPFTIDLTKNKTVGDYRNVILFKSANATVTQLARHPELWTRYADFNDATADADGRFLSNWLVQYLADAKTLHDGGVASLQDFCDLIDDPTWNGFLALKVDIDIKALPPPVEALLAGIDESLFVAHHIGNQVNHVTPPADPKSKDGYQLNSAMFGLVHYVDPALGALVNNMPSYIANPQAYDFKVLTLEAIFENAQLLTFSNKSLLTLNTLFGDAVRPADAAGDPGANTLVLTGSYNHNNDPAYTFSTAKGAIADFYVASNALDCIEITRTTMTVTTVTTIETNVTGEAQCSETTQTGPPPAGTTAYLARFNLSGNLRFAADPTFDLLSYQALGFENLGLDMYLVSGGGDRSFAFDSSAMRIALAQNVGVDPDAPDDGRTRDNAGSNLVRFGSLLAQFPLQLTGFITNCGGRLPDAMGYRTLETTKPDGITPATLSAGSWYALSFGLNLGGQGALGQNGGLSAEMLLAWTPGGQPARPSVLPALKIAGPGGVSLSFDLEGVVKFGAADIVLNKMKSLDQTPDQFVLMFESIAFSVLSFSFPPQGTTNIFLFGDTSTTAKPSDPLKPTLGWFGGYVEKPAPVS